MIFRSDSSTEKWCLCDVRRICHNARRRLSSFAGLKCVPWVLLHRQESIADLLSPSQLDDCSSSRFDVSLQRFSRGLARAVTKSRQVSLSDFRGCSVVFPAQRGRSLWFRVIWSTSARLRMLPLPRFNLLWAESITLRGSFFFSVGF